MMEKRRKNFNVRKAIAFHQLWFFCCWMERFLVAVGILCSVIVGLTVPVAVYLIGEVVTLFITNRRARLMILQHFKMNLTNTGIEVDGKVDFLQDNVSLPNTTQEIDYNILNVGKEAIKINNSVHQILNVNFSSYLFQVSLWMIYTSLVQLIGGFFAQSTLNFAAERQMKRISRSLQIINIQNSNETSEYTNTALLKTSSYPDTLIDIRAGSGACVANVVSSFVTFISCLSLAFYRRWELAAILIPIVPVTIIGRRITNTLHRTQSRQITIAEARAKAHVQEVLEAGRTVIAFGGESLEINSYCRYLAEILQPIQKRAKYLGISNATILMATHALNALLLWYGVQLIMNDLRQGEAFLPGTPVVVFFSFMRGLTAFIQALPAASTIYLAKDSAQRLSTYIQKYTKEQVKGFLESNLLLSILSRKEADTKTEENRRKKQEVDSRKHQKKRKKKIKEKKKDCITQKINLRLHLIHQLPYLLIGSLASILLGVIVPALFYVFCEIIGAMANIDEELVLEKSLYNSGIYLFLGTTTFLGTYIQKSMIESGAVRFGNGVKREIFTKILKQKKIWFFEGEEEMNEIKNLLQKEVDKLEQAVRSMLGGGVQMSAGVLACIPIGLSVVWKQTAVLSYSIPALLLFQTIKICANSKWKKRSNIKGFSALPILVDAFLQGILSCQREFLLGTILIYGGTLIVNEGVGNKDVLQVNLVMINSVLLVGQVVQAITDLKAGKKAAKKINEWLNKRGETRNGSFSQFCEKIRKNESFLELRKVTAEIKNHASTLVNLDLKAETGQQIIIVGKRIQFLTLIEILLKLQKAKAGDLLIEGCNIETIPDEVVRDKIRIVSSELPFFMERSLFDNISYRDKTSKDVLTKIIEATTQAGIHDSIHKLSQEYNTQLRMIYNKFNEIELKKLMIARAIFSKPKILIMEINNKEEQMLIDQIASLETVNLYLLDESLSSMSSTNVIHLKTDNNINTEKFEDDRIIMKHPNNSISV